MSTPLAVRSFEYWILQYRRTWRASIVTGLLSPLLFLAAMGLGLGALVGRSHGDVDGVRYVVYIAPGLLAASAMQAGVIEGTWPVLGSVKWTRAYFGMLATPLRVVDVLVGHMLYIIMRLAIASLFFLAVMAAFGTVHSWLALAELPAAVLTGLAFAVPVMAFAMTVRQENSFAVLFRFGVVPLFLFSGTFFPISQLPAALRPVAYATPLWHGVQLCRELNLGQGAWPALLGHAAYLVALATAGFWVARVTFRRRLTA